MNPNDLALIKNYTQAGLGLGAGAGALTALMNHLMEVKREATDANPLNKDVLKLTLRKKNPDGTEKMASGQPSASFMRGPLAIISGLLAAGVGYTGARGLHQYYKKQKLQKDLDDAQSGYLNVLDPNAPPKSAAAGKGMSGVEALSSLPLTGGAIAALATAVVANAALRKTFPDAKPGTRLGPKKVVLNYADSDQPPTSIPVDKNAHSLLIDVVVDSAMADSPTRDLVYAVAQGRYGELCKVAASQGVESIFDVVHGASNKPVSLLRVKLASQVLADDGVLGPMVIFMAASEFADHAPNQVKLAAFLSPALEVEMIKAARAIQTEFYTDTLIPMLERTGDAVERLCATAPTKYAAAKILEIDALPMHLIPGLIAA